MSFSLNEIDALCRKAARGAGLGWGHAEDAGKAARWLQAHGLPGAESLLECLENRDAPQGAMIISGAIWQCDGPLCPIIAGASLSDHAAALTGGTITLQNVRHPVLLAPFAASVAALTNRTTRLEWPGASVTLTRKAAEFDGQTMALLAPGAAKVTCRHVASAIQADAPSCHRASMMPETYDRLCALAQRTYAPATEASRAAGAGAGLTDND